MKLSVVFSALAFFALYACGSTSQESGLEGAATRPHVPRLLTAALTELNLDSQLLIGTNFGATLEVDQVNKNVLVQFSTCPPNAFCIWAGPSYSAKLINKTTDACGAVTYKAREDRRPVDGSLVEITAKDYSHLRCRIFRAFKTEVELTTSHFDRLDGREVTTHSTLKGTASLQ